MLKYIPMFKSFVIFSTRLGPAEMQCVCVSRFFFIENRVSVLSSTNLFFNKTFIKNGPHTLFTHLKIILLLCFQFSVK